MAIINIPVGGGTFTANSGEAFNSPAGADPSPCAMDADCENLTVIVGDGGSSLHATFTLPGQFFILPVGAEQIASSPVLPAALQ